MPGKKRAATHVRANIVIWENMVRNLEESGISSLEQLMEFLDEPPPIHSSGWNYPLPREKRLSLPPVPGVYRFLSKDGEVLYVGKASSLRSRVNTYFTKRKADRKTLELVSQVYDVSIDLCETPLEAALLEFETIRKLHPPYNVTLKNPCRKVVFLSPDLSYISPDPGPEFPAGPVPEDSPALLLNELQRSLLAGDVLGPGVLGLDYLPIEDGALEEGFSFFREEFFPHGSMSMDVFLSVGKRIWLSRHEEENIHEDQIHEAVEIINSNRVKKHLEWLVSKGSRDIRQAAWFCLLGWSVIKWNPLARDGTRSLKIEAGRTVSSQWANCSAPAELTLPDLSRLDRQSQIDSLCFDLLKILNSELRRTTFSGAFKSVYIPGNYVLTRQKVTCLFRFI